MDSHTEMEKIKMTKMIAIVLFVVMAFSLVSCAANNDDNTQISNPWTECNSIEEAVTNAGFAFEVPTEIGEYGITYIQNLGDKIIEVTYQKADDSDTEISIRKCAGTEDVSGDYNVYTESKQVSIGEYEVTEKGNNGSVSLITWTFGNFFYAVSVPEISAEEVDSFIQLIK